MRGEYAVVVLKISDDEAHRMKFVRRNVCEMREEGSRSGSGSGDMVYSTL